MLSRWSVFRLLGLGWSWCQFGAGGWRSRARRPVRDWDSWRRPHGRCRSTFAADGRRCVARCGLALGAAGAAAGDAGSAAAVVGLVGVVDGSLIGIVESDFD